MGKKKNFYVVLKGHRQGIFTRWEGEDGAKAQVSGFPNALYRGFPSREHAEYYFKTGGQLMPESLQQEPAPELAQKIPDYQAELARGQVVIFTDGACTGNPGPGGYGVVLLSGKHRLELSGGFRCTTNNRMELMACIIGLEALKGKSLVSLYSDSRYVVNSIRLGWADRWRKNDWFKASRKSGIREKVENIDLWERLMNLLQYYQVTFYWVKGHALSLENERCDQMAVAAARGSDLPEDPGYPLAYCE